MKFDDVEAGIHSLAGGGDELVRTMTTAGVHQGLKARGRLNPARAAFSLCRGRLVAS